MNHLTINRFLENIDLIKPLPAFGGSAISEDFADILMDRIIDRRPEVIVELGSGVSTLVSAYCLKKNGAGKIYSVDNDKKYLEITRGSLMSHGLMDYVELILAPIKRNLINWRMYTWYDIAKLKQINSIDMLIIDGPYRGFGKNIRYPALPFFYKNLSSKAEVILDDANRRDEQNIVDLWCRKYRGFSRADIDTKTGAIILSKDEISKN